MNPPQPKAARKPERLVMQHPATSIPRQHLGDCLVVASDSEAPTPWRPLQ
jgi:hypothetical protein